MYETSLSSVPVKGLTTNSQRIEFQQLDLVYTPPTTSPDNGIWNAGEGGATAPYRLKLFPYCEGAPGARFKMRLCGWDNIGSVPETLVWIPYLIVEFTCTACTRSGPRRQGYLPVRNITESELMCDTMELTNGTLGVSQVDGVVCSTGPGTNLVAWAIVDLAGCRKYQFDFETIDAVTMNVLFSRA